MLKPSLLVLLFSTAILVHADPFDGVEGPTSTAVEPKEMQASDPQTAQLPAESASQTTESKQVQPSEQKASPMPMKKKKGTAKKSTSAAVGPRTMRMTVRNIEAGGIGYNKGYSTFEAFFASDIDRWAVMPFLDLRGHIFNDGKWAANGGVGLRTMQGCSVYGVSAYYDYRGASRLNYNQVGVGFEWLNDFVDIRCNGYLPFGKRVSGPYHPEFGGFKGNSILVSRRYQFAMTGGDAELGFHFGKTDSFDFYAAAGPYYFRGKFDNQAIGGKARFAAYYKDYISMELSNSYDNVFHYHIQGQLALSLPFGPSNPVKSTRNNCKTSRYLEHRMVQPVTRQEIIVLDSDRKNKAASNTVIFVDNLSHSAGTFESPYATLADAQDNSAAGDIIYVFPGDGTINGMMDGIALQPNQKFWGSGVSHPLVTNLGNITIPAQTDGSPAISNGSANAIDLASNVEVAGFTITKPAGEGLFGDDIGAFTISDMNISACGDNGISIVASSDIRCELSRIKSYGNNGSGINFNFSGAASSTIAVSDANCYFNINEGIRVSCVDNSAVTIGVQNSLLENNSDMGLLLTVSTLNPTPITLAVRNSEFNNNNNEGIRISGTSQDIVFDSVGNRYFGNKEGGFFSFVDGRSLTFNLANDSYSEQGSNGVNIDDFMDSSDSVHLNVSGCLFAGNGSVGLNEEVTCNTCVINVTSSCFELNNDSGFRVASDFSDLDLVVEKNIAIQNRMQGMTCELPGLSSETGSITFSNNKIFYNQFNGILLTTSSSGGGTVSSTFDKNEVGYNDNGIRLVFQPTADLTYPTVLSNNTCYSNAALGISIESVDHSLATIHAEGNKLYKNRFADTTNYEFLVINESATSSVCLTLVNNNSAHGYELSKNGGTGDFNLAPNGVSGAQAVNIGLIVADADPLGSVPSCP